MTQINVYVNFNGKCREAMTFYKECIGGELSMQKISESPIADQCPASMQDNIMHSTLMRNGVLMLMGSDMTGPEYVHGNDVALSFNCSSEEEVKTFFAALSEGGIVLDPLSVKFWGAWFGVITDKFGIRWMLHYDKNQQL